jgi:proprotein convertase subtilisin/kexin type 5
MTCLACNSPCGNCTQHPSKCLNCLSGSFFEFGCVESCPTGTFSENKTCKYCSFECAACLGSSNTCIACPDNQYLFEGKCHAKCPIPLVNGKCPNLCPTGYFTQVGSGNCLKCNDRCRTCDGAADRCTSCQSGFASNGACVTACPANTLNVNGNCVACAEGCNGCRNTISECSACQSGFFLVGGRCVASCDAGFFRDGNNGCRKCPDTCNSCTLATACTSCVETRNQPINGICYNCIYPCTACTSYEQCTTCLTGFSVVNGRCTSQCPAGSSSVGGVCRCTNGVFQNGQCVASCPAGFTNIDGTCQQCDSSCGECSGKITTCTACKTGFLLNGVSGTCDVNRNCQFGEFFSAEAGICRRICPTGYSFQDSLCVSECLSGFRDNGFGGCIEQGVVTGCSFPYFFQQGSCVSTCNAGTYPNTATRVCEACSSNCFSCMSSAFCTSCSSGFDLKSNICITGERCANNKLKYNGVCLDSCPVGTIASNGYCERRCDPNTYFLDNKCYGACPSGFASRTDVACVSQCPTGYILDGSVCKLSVQTCPSGQFYNAQNGLCTACVFPCTECQYTNSYCTACPAGFAINSNKCAESNSCGSGRFRTASGSCSTCPQKCVDCVSATECSTCASGYVFNGADCILRVTNLREIQITQSALSRRNNTVFITIRTSIIPNGLSSEQQNGFFIVVPSSNDRVNKVNQWVNSGEQNTIMVAVEYASYPATTSTLFVALNAGILSTSLANVGFTASENSFLSVVISNGVATAPATLVVPGSATNSQPAGLARLGTNARARATRVLGSVL